MATTLNDIQLRRAPRVQKRSEHPASNWRFDLWVALFSGLFLFGLYLDGWAHNNLPESLETFFTPWHAVLYGGFMAITGIHIITQARNMAQGHTWNRALPRGYGLSLFGIGLFFLGGIADGFWHELLGIEVEVEALLSPPHLLLATGGTLFLTGPLRAAWGRHDHGRAPGWGGLLPALLSLFSLVSVLIFFTQFAHFMGEPKLLVRHPGGNTFVYDVTNIASALIPTGIVMGAFLLVLRRWQLPVGLFTFLMGGTSTLMFVMRFDDASPYSLVLGAILAACVAIEVGLLVLRPSVERVGALRLFAFGAPVVLMVTYFLTLRAGFGLWWSIHMWMGVTMLAGFQGFFLSYLVVPPMIDSEV